MTNAPKNAPMTEKNNSAPDESEGPRGKNSLVADYKAGDEFDDIFIIGGLEKRVRKNGKPYYNVTLADRSGAVVGKIWDGIEAFEQRGYALDEYVHAKGRANEYQGRIDCNINFMRPLDRKDVNPADFVAVSPRPLGEMRGELHARIEEVTQPDLRRLLDFVFDKEAKLYHDFMMAPSAKKVHQAYLHGLVEHTLNVVSNALNLAEAPQNARIIDRELLLTGALIHDIGKTIEYRWSPRIDYTVEGQLLGHITLGGQLIAQIAPLIDLPSALHAHLQHLILSHHGRMEYGSPKIPATAEALLLHYADLADAQLAVYEELVEKHTQEASGDVVTSYSPFIERRIIPPAGFETSRDKMVTYIDDFTARSGK